jgi:glyoxylase-like metal-dependent hydrolase (beta-lactamase superfamily II)
MLRETRHDDVVRLFFETPQSRMMGLNVSAYVVRGVLIDSGFPAVAGELDAWLATHPLRGAIVSHYHEDHAGNVDRLVARGVPVQLAPETLAHIEKPDRIGLYRRICWGVPRPLARLPEPFSDASLALVPAVGHSVDHHVVWDASTGTAFGGDLFIGVKVRVAHPPEREDIRRQIQSLRNVIALAPDRYFDAHRGLVPDPIAQLSAKADWMEETVGRIDSLVAEGLGDEAIARRVLGNRDIISTVSFGDYSRVNVVRSVRATGGRAPADDT